MILIGCEIKNNSLNVEIIDNDRPRAHLRVITDGTEHAEPGRFRVELDSNPDTTDNSSGIEVHYEIKVEHVDEDVTYKGKDGEILEGDKRLSSIHGKEPGNSPAFGFKINGYPSIWKR